MGQGLTDGEKGLHPIAKDSYSLLWQGEWLYITALLVLSVNCLLPFKKTTRPSEV